MSDAISFVDIHCHLLPGIDDGSDSWDESAAMAEIALGNGITTVIVTPHQLGTFGHNSGDLIRRRTSELQGFLEERGLPLEVLPGADVRIEDGMAFKVRSGDVLTLADRRKHLLLELPHELYFPLGPVLEQLRLMGIEGILSHPERNQGILQTPAVLDQLLQQGCLMQVTAGSLMGTFGPRSQELAERMVLDGQVHFVATDAHGPRSRRPLMRRAFERVAELVDQTTAIELCSTNPRAVACGETVTVNKTKDKRHGVADWFGWRKAG